MRQANDADYDAWCDVYLPDIYDTGMFDAEDIHEDILEAIVELIQDTVLEPLLDSTTEEERDAISEQLIDTAVDWLKAQHTAFIESLIAIPPHTLLKREQVAQHSADWYSQRRNRLTASEFAHILDGRRGSLLRSKIEPTVESDCPIQAPIAIAQPDGEMNATSWGHRFEPIVRQIYEIELAGLHTVADNVGRFTHETIPWLSASPDGIVVDGSLAGRLLEIKAPKTRIPGVFVPFEYYVQMQIQMEVCNLPAVDFVEAQFCQRPVSAITESDFAAIHAAKYKGRIRIYGFTDDPQTWKCYRSEPVEDLDDAQLGLADNEALPLLEDSIWWLIGWSPRTVLRNQSWWQQVGWPAAQQFWAEVESQRIDNIITHEGPTWLGVEKL